MNAVLNINVRVSAAQARQALKAAEGDIKRLQSTAAAGPKGSILGGAFSPSNLDRFGKQLQWTGRQLEFSFTLPLLLAAGAATKWSLDNQRAMVQVQKVYGDGTESAAQLRGELDALGKSFELLSSRFGVNQKEVIEIGGAWAQAGSAGVGLARSVRLTMETMILGQLDAAKATEGLIGIQSAYRLNTEQLRDVIADLNRIENQTGITLGGLIDVISRAGGTAKTAGISIQQLAAYAAALVPAAGSAAQAGNALRTIISRIMAPTKESSELMQRMGINIFDAGWQSQTAVGRIETLAKAFMNQSDAQKTAISTAVASRWQLNRFDLMMEQVANRSGFYARALDTVGDSQKNLGGQTKAQIQMQKELMTALESDPQQFSILWNTLKNTMSSAIQPVIPYLIILVQKIVNLVKGFKDLSPPMKQAVTVALVFLALLGPIARYVGAVSLLLGTTGHAFKFFNKHLIGTAGNLGLFSRMVVGTFTFFADIAAAALWPIARTIDVVIATSTRIWAGGWAAMSRIAYTASLNIRIITAALQTGMAQAWATSTAAIAGLWTRFWTFVVTTTRAASAAILGSNNLLLVSIRNVWIATSLFVSGLWNQLWLGLSYITSTAGTAMAAMVNHVGMMMRLYWTATATFMSQVWGRVWAVMATITRAGTIAVGLITRALIIDLPRLWTALGGFMVTAWTRTWVAMRSVAVAGTVNLAAIVDMFAHTMRIYWSGMATFASRAWARMWIVINTITRTAVIQVGRVLAVLNTVWSSLWIVLRTVAVAGMTQLVVITNAGLLAMQTRWVAFTGAIPRIWAAMWFVMTAISATAISKIAAFFGSAALAILHPWRSLGRLLVAIWGLAWGAVSAVMGPIGTALVGAVNAIGVAMNRVWATRIATLALPPAAVVTAVIGAFVLMIAWIEEHVEGGFRQVVRNIGNALSQLPRIIGSVFVAVARVLQRAMIQIMDMLSYLNPFARHSPSLVDSVVAGVAKILSQYSRLNRIPGILKTALEALDQFRAASGSDAEEIEFQEKRTNIVSVTPTAGAAVDTLWAVLKDLRGELKAVQIEIIQQERVVQQWDDALEAANNTLRNSERELDRLQLIASDASDALRTAKDELDRLKDIKLTGWHAMDEAIFQNEMAVNNLRLAILRMEDAGLSVDDLKSKLSKLAGQIEMLRGEASDLRQAGAGSDVLGPIDQEIAMLERQRDAIQAQGAPINDLQTQLDKLQRRGEILDLEKSLQFDPMTRQIEQAGTAMQEMPFDQLYAQIAAQIGVIDQLEAAWRDADAAVTAQQAVVDQHKASRDAIQETYDQETDKLRELKDAYSTIEGAIRDMENSFNDAASAASQMIEKLTDTRSQAEQMFDAGEGFDFPDVGGIEGIGREGDLFDIEQFNKDLEKELAGALKGMSFKIDLFKPIKDQFVAAWEWIKDNSSRLILGALAGMGIAILLGVTGWPVLIVVAIVAGLNAIFGGRLWEAIKAGFDWVADLIGPYLSATWNFLSTIFTPIFAGIGDGFKWVWDNILQPVLRAMADLFSDVFTGIGDTLSTLWKNVLEPVLRFIGNLFETVFRAIADVARWLWREVLEPAFTWIATQIENYLVPVLQMLLAIGEIVFVTLGRIIEWLWRNVISNIFTLIGGAITILWTAFRLAFEGIRWLVENVLAPPIMWLWNNVVSPVFDWIGGAISTAWNTVIRPVFEALGNFIRDEVAPVFTWLRDEVIDPVFGAIGRIISAAWGGITDTIRGVANFFIRAFNWIARGIKRVASFLNISVSIDEMPEIRESSGGGGGQWGGGMAQWAATRHSGGLVRDERGDSLRRLDQLRSDEVVNVLQKGEYILPASTVRQIGWRNLEHLRKPEEDLVRPETGGIDIGKWFSDRRENVENIVGGVRRGAVTAVAQPFLAAADAAISIIPHNLFRAAAQRVKDDFYDWLKGVDSKTPDPNAAAQSDQGGAGQVPGWGWKSIVDWLNKQPNRPPFRVTSTLRIGDPGRHGRGLAVDLAGPTPGRNTPQLANIYRALLPIAKTLNELIYYGPGGAGWKNGAPHTYSIPVQADHHDHVHAAMAHGGIVTARTGGRLVRVGEAGADEAIIPLPTDWRRQFTGGIFDRAGHVNGGMTTNNITNITHNESTTVIEINGNLEFPNISDGDDAKAFVRNLAALVD